MQTLCEPNTSADLHFFRVPVLVAYDGLIEREEAGTLYNKLYQPRERTKFSKRIKTFVLKQRKKLDRAVHYRKYIPDRPREWQNYGVL